MSLNLSRAGFYNILNSAPSKIRLYTGVEHSVCSEHHVSSALETELLSRLSGFEAPELHQSALCGPEFLMKRVSYKKIIEKGAFNTIYTGVLCSPSLPQSLF